VPASPGEPQSNIKRKQKMGAGRKKVTTSPKKNLGLFLVVKRKGVRVWVCEQKN